MNYFWQTIVFGFMYVVAFVAYISSPASVTYMRHAFSFVFSHCLVSLLSETSVSITLSDFLWAVSLMVPPVSLVKTF